MCRWNVSWPAVAIAGHTDKIVWPELLSMKLIFDERLTRQMQDQRLAQIKAGNVDGPIDPLQPGELKGGIVPFRLGGLSIFQGFATLLFAKQFLLARRKFHGLDSPSEVRDRIALSRFP